MTVLPQHLGSAMPLAATRLIAQWLLLQAITSEVGPVCCLQNTHSNDEADFESD